MTPHAGVTGERTARSTTFTRLCLDPGIRIAGASLFRNDRLIAATLIRNPVKTGNGVAACVAMAREIFAWSCHTLYTIPTVGTDRRGDAVDELCTEWPKIYASRIRRGQTKEDPAYLLGLVGVGSALGALCYPATLTHVEPDTWKGQVPADSFTARILGRLEPDEIEVLAKAVLDVDPILLTDRIEALLKHSTAHNAIDSIGIGLYQLDRLTRRRVIHR